jgi:hypothetical protein
LSDTIRIKRRSTGAVGPPATLANAELAFNEVDETLYYGKGGTATAAATIIPIAGTSMAGGGNVSNSGTPVGNQLAQWTDATHIRGIDIASLGLAPLASPVFTGDPRAPTPTAGDADTSIATTAFVSSAISTAGGSYQPLDADLTSLAGASAINAIFYRSAANTWGPITIGGNLTWAGGALNAVVGEAGTSGIPYVRQSGGWADASLIFAPLASPVFTGDPRAPTPALSDSDTSIATTAWVKGQGYEIAVNKGAANGYASLDASAKVPAAQLPSYVDDVVEYANLAAFPATGTTGVIYVALDTGKIYRWSGSAYVEISPSPGSTDAVPEGSTNLYYTEARVSANATVTSKAPLASPTFTGDPKAPTPTAGDNDTSIATTAFVQTAIASKAPLASPVFTGDPQAPTPATADNDTSIATTAFVKAQGYVGKSGTPVDNQIAVWTGATAIEGPTNLTFDGLTLSTPGLKGTTAAAAAAAGDVGEYQQAILASPTTPTVSTIVSIHALSLTAGDWDVWANIQIVAPSGSGTGVEWDLSATASLSGVFPNYQMTQHTAASAMDQVNLGPFRFQSASPLTITLMARTGVANTQINRSFIAARRRR